MKFEYMPRIIDEELEEYLEMVGAILIEGPKWCGKTTTGMQHSKSVVKLQDSEFSENYIAWTNVDAKKILRGENPRLIDEWQMAPILWDAVRFSVDERDEEGLYILTGSTVVDYNQINHPGTGRIHRVLMRPMSLYESGESNGKISILELFKNPDLDIDGIESDLSMEDLIFAACRGGWPAAIKKKSKKTQLFVARSYIDNICQIDVSAVDNVKRDPTKVRNILRSYARNVSTLASKEKMVRDINTEVGKLGKTTFYDYLNVLKRLFVIEDIPAWSPNIRSNTPTNERSKKEFFDPSLAVASLRVNPDYFEKDLKTFGFIFENLCIRDLKVYTNSELGEVFYFNSNNCEVDCILQLANGDYGLIEFKLGGNGIKKGIDNLLKLRDYIEKKKEDNPDIRDPSFMAIITGGRLAYTEVENIKIIPIGCLR